MRCCFAADMTLPKYRKDGKRIMLIGVNFDFHTDNITDWLKEECRG